MSVTRECLYLGKMYLYLVDVCPYIGSESYEAKLIMENRFFPTNFFESTITLDKSTLGTI